MAITKIYESYDPTQLVTTDHVFAIQNLTGKLIEIGEDNSLYSAIAQSWQVSPDRRTYKFTLSPGAKFSDGTPIEVEDVLLSLKRQMLFSGTHMDMREKVLGAKTLKRVTDDVPGLRRLSSSEFEIEIIAPDERFLFWIAFPETVILPRREALKPQGQISFAVTSGPYFLKPGNGYLHLEMNPHFYATHGTAAKCVHLYGEEDPERIIVRLLNHELDLVHSGSMFSPSFSKVVDSPDFELSTNESNSLVYFLFNTRNKVCAQRSHRRWFTEKVQAANVISYGKDKLFFPATQFLAKNQQGYLSPSEVEQSNAGAQASRPPVDFIRVLYPAVFGKTYESHLKAELAKSLGMQVEIVTYPEGGLLEALASGQWDLFFFLVGMGEKATNILLSYHFGGQIPLYTWKDDVIDAAMRRMMATGDESERKEQYKVISKRLLSESYLIPIANFTWPVVLRSDLFFEKLNQFEWGQPIWTLSWKN